MAGFLWRFDHLSQDAGSRRIDPTGKPLPRGPGEKLEIKNNNTPLYKYILVFVGPGSHSGAKPNSTRQIQRALLHSWFAPESDTVPVSRVRDKWTARTLVGSCGCPIKHGMEISTSPNGSHSKSPPIGLARIPRPSRPTTKAPSGPQTPRFNPKGSKWVTITVFIHRALTERVSATACPALFPPDRISRQGERPLASSSFSHIQVQTAQLSRAFQ